jgi:hypothetical protein
MTKKALLVGINDYAPGGAGGPDLRGCVNDVRDMANTLSVLGIVPAAPTTMRILTDARATRAAILTSFRWLLTGAKRGDVLVFYYSGHGSQVIDVGGDEADRRDETICPHDYATAGMIKDDDLRSLLAALPPGVNLDVILDSCHSGSATRDLPPSMMADELLGEPAFASRYIEPPLDYGFFLDANPSIPLRSLMKPGGMEGGRRDAVAVPGLNHVVWAGCRDNQTSAEAPIGGVWRGVFTYNYCKALRGAGLAVTRRRLDAQVTVNVRGMGYAQVGQLEGTNIALDERVFT